MKNESRMTVGERSELTKWVRMRSKVRKSDVMARTTTLLARFEAQLASRYDEYDSHWREIAQEAEEKVKQLDSELAKRCQALGIPVQFRPSLELSWYGRGENADKQRRQELRAVAESELEAQATQAKSRIEHDELDLITEIVQEGLGSERAKAFFESLPPVEELVPELTLNAVEKKTAMPRYLDE